MTNINEVVLRSQVRGVSPLSEKSKTPEVGIPQGKSFDQVLGSAELQFSKHAERRLQTRQIDLQDADRAKLNEAVHSLERKGAKDSLVLMGELAFVVNVPSKTVVTALSKEQMKEQVFTNIDSTIIV
jgi:flagellar operon protein